MVDEKGFFSLGSEKKGRKRASHWEGRRKKGEGRSMRRVFFTILGKNKERTIYDPNIFGCGEGRGGRKARRREERRRGK